MKPTVQDGRMGTPLSESVPALALWPGNGAGPCLSARVVCDDSRLFAGPGHDSLPIAGYGIQQATRRRATRLTSGVEDTPALWRCHY